VSLPGFFGVSLYDVGVFILQELQNQNLTMRANSMAFSFFLSLFPAVIMFFTLIAYLPMADVLTQNIEGTIRNVMPGNTGEEVVSVIKSVTQRRRTVLLSLSFLLALIFSSNGINTMLAGFSKKHYRHSFRRIGFWRRRWIAIKLTMLLALTLVVSVSFGILGHSLMRLLARLLHLPVLLQWGTGLLRWLVSFLIYYASISFLYRYGMQTRHSRIPFFNPGATLAALLSLLTSLVFSYYVNNFALYNKIYGPLGTLIVTMIWIQLNASIILLGFELNAGIVVGRYQMQDRGKAVP